VRLGIDAFYSRLGVTTEEVGLTYAAILSRAALGLLVAFVAALLAAILSSVQFSVGYFFAGAERQMGRAESMKRGTPTKLEARQVAQPWLVIMLLSVPGGFLALLSFASSRLAFPELNSVTTNRVLFLANSAYGLVGIVIAYKYSGRAASPAISGKGKWPQTGARIAISVFVFLLLAGAIWISNRAGDRAAQRVASGETLSRSQAYGLPWIFDVEAKCVTLVRMSDGKPPANNIASSRLLYLGKSSDTLVFYSVGVGPVRIPPGDYAIKGITTKVCR
jgi:hypothetical protein